MTAKPRSSPRALRVGRDDVRREDARRAARALLRRFGVEAAEHIHLDAIASKLGAVVIDCPELAASDARIVRAGGVAYIRLSTRRLAHAGRRRFSLAHELGHLALANGGADAFAVPLACNSAADPLAQDREAEADTFAAELLMPEALVRKRCEVSPLSLDVAAAIAGLFRTSLVASAVRLAELTSERCAVVYSEGGAVRWSSRSATFGPWIERGTPLDPDTVAYDLARGRRRRYDDGPQLVTADAWFETPGRGGDVVEHSVIVPETGGVLTLLWVPEAEAWRLGWHDDD